MRTMIAITVVSLVVWVAFYLLYPDAPLRPPETAVVVGVCAAVVLGAKWLWSSLQRRRS